MKKIGSLPTPPRPQEVDEVDEIKEIQTVPVAKIGSINLKKYTSFQETRSSIKLSNQELLATTQLKTWLSSIDCELNMMNLELIIDVINFCESFFIYGSREQRETSINKTVHKVLRPFCKEDDDIVCALIKSVEHRIVRSTKFTRRKQQLVNFFCTMLSTFYSISVRA